MTFFEIVTRRKEMEKRVRYNGLPQGKSRLEGYDFGEYPIHKFRCVNDPGPMYPLWTFACGVDEWRIECYRQRTFSDTFAVEYVQNGVFIFQQNNITMKVNPGEIFLVHLDKNNSMRCETKFATKKTVIMRGALLRSNLEVLGLNRIDRIVPKNHERIDRIFERLYQLCEKTDQANYQEMSILCYSLLLELTEQTTVMQRPVELQRALEYINHHLEGALPLEDLVRYSGVSRATLHRQFRKYLKTSPINYFLDQKLERAKILLENNLCSIKEIAEQFHYASAQYFSHEFKKKYGMPPKHCKLRIRN